MNKTGLVDGYRRIIAALYAWRIVLICVGISVLGLQQRVATLSGRALWNDEIYQLSVMRGDFKAVWGHNFYGDFSCFPGDYLISYPFVRWFGSDKWGIMIPHILVTIAGFVLLYFLCRRYFRTAFAFFVTFAIVAMNQNLVYYSFEFRPYGVLPVLTLGAFLCLDIMFSRFRSTSYWARGLMVLFLSYFMVFHIYSLLILLLLAAFQIFSRRNDSKSEPLSGAFLAYLLGVFGLLTGIWLWYAAPNLGIFGFQQTLFQGKYDVFQFMPNPAVDPNGFFKAVFGNLIGCSKLKWTLLGIAAFFVPWNEQRFKQAGFLFLVIVLGLQVVFLATLLKEYWFLQRQFTWVMPLTAFLLGWLWDSLLSRKAVGRS